jgi:ABC-2 type transport system ATP-binding protein
MTEAVLLNGVHKRYKQHTAVRDLSLAVPTGSIYGLLGPNGAGKSTTLRMLMNIIARDAGDIRLLGEDPAQQRLVLRRVGYLPEERGLYKKMKAIDVVVFFAGLKGVPEDRAREEGTRWLERMGLEDWRDAKVETLSKGMQQKVQFITTVLHEPEILILDEPHSGLDPVNQEVLRETILDAAKQGRTVLLSTHNMEQAEQLCEYVCIIAGGQKVLDGKLRELRRAHRGNRYLIELDGEAPDADRFMDANRMFAVTERRPHTWIVELTNGASPANLLAGLGELSVPLRRFEHLEPSLHEIFVSRVGDATKPVRRTEPSNA